MLKALIKKQWLELGAWFYQDRRNNKKRSKGSMVGMILLYAFLIVCFCGLFASMSMMLCAPLVDVGLDWLYFAILSLIAVTMGVIGSVFSTYATLYLAKDNELLLSLPIPPSHILAVRLSGVWFWGAIYSAPVFFPAMIVYLLVATPGFLAAFAGIFVFLLLSLFILTLSCLLGWLVAKISRRLKAKTLITVLASLLFIGAYFFLYSKAYDMLQSLVANAEAVGAKVKGGLYPLYLLGRAATGHVPSLLVFGAGILVIFALMVFVLARSFLKLATASNSVTKKEYRPTGEKTRSPFRALLGKERGRFLSSPTYMLNSSMGTLFLLVLGVLALIKGHAFRETLATFFAGNEAVLTLLAAAAVCLVSSMNVITAPSVSLEGKNIWLVQSLPVSPWQALLAKLVLHLLLTEIPVLFCSISLSVALRPGVMETLGLLVAPCLFVLCTAALGLIWNLKWPNLKWSNETAAVKQGLNVMLALFGGWILVMVLGGAYAIVHVIVPAGIFLWLACVLFAGGSFALLRWLKTRGAEIFAAL